MKVFVHPFVLIASFFMVFISGEGWGAFYVVYIFMGLLQGVIHSILGTIGVLLILMAYSVFRLSYWNKMLNILGDIFLLMSLFVFFFNDSTNYNTGTFSDPVPLGLFVCFIILAVLFLVANSFSLYKTSVSRKIT